MQCEDNSKLRTPLSEVCQTTDIGCVPITDGAPTCTPQPDELPVALDPKTTTLWLFSCKTREWIPFQKFTMCQLDALNLENITNICDVLNIGVNYAGSGDCQQGTITLRELAERILECLTLETKIITIGQGDGNKLKISIEGLPLDPVYVTGRNIWSEGGSGTETDPLLVATHDPICKWPIKTQSQVDAAGTKHLGACLDGEMSRVPFPPKVCELPSRNQAQVDATDDKELIACLDGEGVKIPYPASPCTYPQMTAEQVQAATDKDIIACVDGQNVKVPVPDNLFEPSICEAPNMTLEESQAAQSTLKLVACKGDGDFSQTVKIPIQGSGLFSYNTDWKYMCVPLTDGYPNGAPAEGTGPLRIDCSGNLFVWLCDQNRWQIVKDGIEALAFLNPDNVPDICNNLRMKAWFSNNGDPCVQDVQMNLAQLVSLIETCAVSNGCKNVFREYRRVCTPRRLPGNRDFDLNSANLVPVDAYTDHKIAVYSSSRFDWVKGSGTQGPNPEGGWDDGVGQREIVINNPNPCRMMVSFRLSAQLFTRPDSFANDDFNATAIATLTDVSNPSWDIAMRTLGGGDSRGFTIYSAKASLNKYMNIVDGYYTGTNDAPQSLACSAFGTANVEQVEFVPPYSSITKYLQGWLVLSSKASSITHKSSLNFGAYVDIREYKSILL